MIGSYQSRWSHGLPDLGRTQSACRWSDGHSIYRKREPFENLLPYRERFEYFRHFFLLPSLQCMAGFPLGGFPRGRLSIKTSPIPLPVESFAFRFAVSHGRHSTPKIIIHQIRRIWTHFGTLQRSMNGRNCAGISSLSVKESTDLGRTRWLTRMMETGGQRAHIKDTRRRPQCYSRATRYIYQMKSSIIVQSFGGYNRCRS